MDPFFAKWHKHKHKIKHRWAKLTDEDIAEIENQDDLLLKLQKHYGFEMKQAIDELTAWKEEEDL